MPLNNTAKLPDIIAVLQTMQGINGKADLASVIGSPATADDSIATINNVIQQAKNVLADKTGQANTESLQKLVDNTIIGKKWASGISTKTGQANMSRLITVSGLDFKPTIVIGLDLKVSNLRNGRISIIYEYDLKVFAASLFQNYNTDTRSESGIFSGGFNLYGIYENEDCYWIAVE